MSDFCPKMFIFSLSLCTAIACFRSSLLYNNDCSRLSLLYSSYLFQAKLACNISYLDTNKHRNIVENINWVLSES